MKKYISLGLIAIVIVAMLIAVFVFEVILNPAVWAGIVIVLAISTVMYSRYIDAEIEEQVKNQNADR